jgi:hypothetical protein
VRIDTELAEPLPLMDSATPGGKKHLTAPALLGRLDAERIEALRLSSAARIPCPSATRVSVTLSSSLVIMASSKTATASW